MLTQYFCNTRSDENIKSKNNLQTDTNRKFVIKCLDPSKTQKSIYFTKTI